MSGTDKPTDETLREIVLSRVWQEGWHAPELRTVDGRRVSVIYRGVWTHANGPDFRDAMLEIDGHLVHGAVEIHLRSSDWRRHGHDADPAYDAVILHVVMQDDGPGPGVSGGMRQLPTVEIGAYLTSPLDELVAETVVVELGTLGRSTCLPTLAGGRGDLVRDALQRKGWERLAARQLRFAQDLHVSSAGAALYRGLLDGLGLVANRAGMAAIADAVPLAMLTTTANTNGRPGALALLLGAAGFLPLAPADAECAEIAPAEVSSLEQHWDTLRTEWALAQIAPSGWSLNRVRPANHPVRRLASLADLTVQAGAAGLLGRYLACIDDAPRAWTRWLMTANPALGAGRIRQIATNVLAPLLAAYADETGDGDLAERAGVIWEQLPGRAEDAISRSALRQIVGETRFPIRTALEEQGLHQIGRFGCAQLRCFECPIAALAARYEALGTRTIAAPSVD